MAKKPIDVYNDALQFLKNNGNGFNIDEKLGLDGIGALFNSNIFDYTKKVNAEEFNRKSREDIGKMIMSGFPLVYYPKGSEQANVIYFDHNKGEVVHEENIIEKNTLPPKKPFWGTIFNALGIKTKSYKNYEQKLNLYNASTEAGTTDAKDKRHFKAEEEKITDAIKKGDHDMNERIQNMKIQNLKTDLDNEKKKKDLIENKQMIDNLPSEDDVINASNNNFDIPSEVEVNPLSKNQKMTMELMDKIWLKGFEKMMLKKDDEFREGFSWAITALACKKKSMDNPNINITMKQFKEIALNTSWSNLIKENWFLGETKNFFTEIINDVKSNNNREDIMNSIYDKIFSTVGNENTRLSKHLMSKVNDTINNEKNLQNSQSGPTMGGMGGFGF